MQSDSMQLRRMSSNASGLADDKQQHEAAPHLVFAQPMEELDASDTEAEKVRNVCCLPI